MKRNKLKEELHLERQKNSNNNSKILKYEKEIKSLKVDQKSVNQKIERLLKLQEKDAQKIKKQEEIIQSLQNQLAQAMQNENNENQKLKNNLDKVIGVKLKYEQIIKAMIEQPEIKPFIADILENK